MSDPTPTPNASSAFERIKRVSTEGNEFWSARDLARVLEYSDFRNFNGVIAKAREACTKSAHAVTDHIVEFTEMVDIGSGARRELEDWALSRYACYLVIQNADPSKPLVALGQTYFAVQTRRQELADDILQSMSSKAQAVIEGFNSLPQVEQLAVYETIARKVTPTDEGPLSDEDLTAIAAETFALLDEEESRAKSR